jgi:hypothetical protein
MKIIAFVYKKDDPTSDFFMKKLESLTSTYEIQILDAKENPNLIEKYNINIVPALIKVDEQENLVHNYKKFGNEEEMRNFLND